MPLTTLDLVSRPARSDVLPAKDVYIYNGLVAHYAIISLDDDCTLASLAGLDVRQSVELELILQSELEVGYIERNGVRERLDDSLRTLLTFAASWICSERNRQDWR